MLKRMLWCSECETFEIGYVKIPSYEIAIMVNHEGECTGCFWDGTIGVPADTEKEVEQLVADHGGAVNCFTCNSEMEWATARPHVLTELAAVETKYEILARDNDHALKIYLELKEEGVLNRVFSKRNVLESDVTEIKEKGI